MIALILSQSEWKGFWYLEIRFSLNKSETVPILKLLGHIQQLDPFVWSRWIKIISFYCVKEKAMLQAELN